MSSRKIKFDRQLIAVQKRSDSLIKLLSVKRNVNDAISHFSNVKPVTTNCQERLDRIINKLQLHLEEIIVLYNELESIDENADPLKLEKLNPRIVNALSETQSFLDNAREFSCPARDKNDKCDNSKKTSNNSMQ
jgi:hypothetical protein